MSEKTRVTVQSITSELDAIRDGAVASEQYAAAKGAVETKAKLHGLLIDRKESGAPGEFSGAQSAADVLAILRDELGDDVAALIEATLATRDAHQATPVEIVEQLPDLASMPSEGTS